MRIVGWLAMVVGVVGIVACLAIAVGAWFVRPTIDHAIDQVVSVAADGMEQAEGITDEVRTSLGEIGSALDDIATRAQEAAAVPTVDPLVASGLRLAVERLAAGPVGELASDAALLRQRATTLSATIQRLDEAIPLVSLPGVVTGAIDELDARLAPLDRAVDTLQQLTATPAIDPTQAARIATAATDAGAQIDGITDGLGAIHLEMERVHSDVVAAGEQVQGLVGIGVIAAVLAAIWVGLLHLLLVAQGRRWARDED